MFNMGHRNYAAGVLGRFISRDPIGFAGGLNLYSYPTNPINFVDPSGLDGTITLNDGKQTQLSFNNCSRMWDFLERQERGAVLGWEIRGHANPWHATMNQTDGPNTQGGVYWHRRGNQVYMWWPDPSRPGKRVYRNLNKLKDKGYEFIELHGCNTAGGHPRGREISEEMPSQKWKDAYLRYGPTENNISRRITKTFPNTQVTGNAGPTEGTGTSGGNSDIRGDSMAPTTYEYIPGFGVTRQQRFGR
jgi:hypothetical protein